MSAALEWLQLRTIYSDEEGRITGELNGHVARSAVHYILTDGPPLCSSVYAALTYAEAYSGTVRVGDEERGVGMWTRLAFIPKRIRWLETLTVEEHLTRAMKLRVAKRVKRKDRPQRAREILERWGLWEHRDTRIAKLSRLHRRITHVAIETIHHPEAAVCESILSDLNADEQIALLSHLCKYVKAEGCAAVLVEAFIRPSFGSFLDSITVIIMSSQYFHGSWDAFAQMVQEVLGREDSAESGVLAVNYLATNPAASESEIKRRVERLGRLKGERVDARRSRGSAASDETLSAAGNRRAGDPRPTNQFSVFLALLKYQFVGDFRSWKDIAALVITAFAVYAIIATIFFQLPFSIEGLADRAGLLYFLCINTFFSTSLYAVVRVDRIRKLLRHERQLGLFSSWTFILAQFIAGLPLWTVSLVVFETAVYYITGLRTDGFEHYLVFIATLLLMAYASMALGILVAMAMGRLDYGQILIPFIGIVFFIFGNLSTAPDATWILHWIQYIDPIYYAVQCLIQNELDGVLPRGEVIPSEFLNARTYDAMPVAACLPALVGFAGLYLLLAMLVHAVRFRPLRMGQRGT